MPQVIEIALPTVMDRNRFGATERHKGGMQVLDAVGSNSTMEQPIPTEGGHYTRSSFYCLGRVIFLEFPLLPFTGFLTG